MLRGNGFVHRAGRRHQLRRRVGRPGGLRRRGARHQARRLRRDRGLLPAGLRVPAPHRPRADGAGAAGPGGGWPARRRCAPRAGRAAAEDDRGGSARSAETGPAYDVGVDDGAVVRARRRRRWRRRDAPDPAGEAQPPARDLRRRGRGRPGDGAHLRRTRRRGTGCAAPRSSARTSCRSRCAASCRRGTAAAPRGRAPRRCTASVSITATSLVTAPQPLEAGQRLLHVVQHTEVEHDVELPEPVEVDGLEVGHDRLHLGAERGGGELEAAPSREVGPPEVGLVARLVREDALLDALGPVGAPGHEVDAPGVVVERHHPGWPRPARPGRRTCRPRRRCRARSAP